MKTFRFYAEMIIDAEDEETAKNNFADNYDLSAEAEVEEVKLVNGNYVPVDSRMKARAV